MKVEPRVGEEGSVFRFTGRGWRPRRRVTVDFGAYCRPEEACPLIGYHGLLRTNREGRFTFRLRAGSEQPGDDERRIRSGAGPSFAQRLRERRVIRAPRYRVIVPSE